MVLGSRTATILPSFRFARQNWVFEIKNQHDDLVQSNA
jgi:hypothetical protein